MNSVKAMPDRRPRPQLERLQRTVGISLRVTLGILCAVTLLVAVSMQLQSNEPVTRLDVATMAVLVSVGAFLAIPGKAVSTLRQKALALAFGLGIACLLLEVFVRVFNPFPILLRAGRIDLPRNVTKEFTTDGQSGLDAKVSVSFNSLGFRGPEPPQNWNDHLTLICVGGSTTQCLYLSNGKTWPDQVSKRLSADFENIWVNNAGIDGHSTFGHLELLDQYLSAMRPKVLVFLVGLNDVDRTDLNGFDESTLRSHVRAHDTFARSLQRSLLRNSDAFALLDNLRLGWFAKQQGLVHGEPIAHSSFSTQLGSRTLSPEDRTKWLDARNPACLAGYRSRLQAIVERCNTLQIRCVLATQPVLYGAGVDDLTGINLETLPVSEVDGATHWELLERYNQVTRDVGLESNVTVIDVAKQLPKSSRYFYDFDALQSGRCRRGCRNCLSRIVRPAFGPLRGLSCRISEPTAKARQPRVSKSYSIMTSGLVYVQSAGR